MIVISWKTWRVIYFGMVLCSATINGSIMGKLKKVTGRSTVPKPRAGIPDRDEMIDVLGDIISDDVERGSSWGPVIQRTIRLLVHRIKI